MSARTSVAGASNGAYTQGQGTGAYDEHGHEGEYASGEPDFGQDTYASGNGAASAATAGADALARRRTAHESLQSISEEEEHVDGGEQLRQRMHYVTPPRPIAAQAQPAAGGDGSQYSTPVLAMQAATMSPTSNQFWTVDTPKRLQRTPSKIKLINQKMQDPNFRRRVDQAKHSLLQHKLDTWQTEILQARLQAYKEDLSEWMGRILDTPLTPSTFMREIASGVLLCRLAEAIDSGDASYRYETSNPGPSGQRLRYHPNAAAGSFQARTNVATFISWARILGVPEAVSFETNDLVERRNEKNVLYCLMEITRCQQTFPPPKLVQLERDIERIIQRGHAEHEADLLPEISSVARELGIDTTHPSFTQRDGLGRFYMGLSKPVFVRRHNENLLVRDNDEWVPLAQYMEMARALEQKRRENVHGPSKLAADRVQQFQHDDQPPIDYTASKRGTMARTAGGTPSARVASSNAGAVRRTSVIRAGEQAPLHYVEGEFDEIADEGDEEDYYTLEHGVSLVDVVPRAGRVASNIRQGDVGAQYAQGQFEEIPEEHEEEYQLRHGMTPEGLSVVPGRRTSRMQRVSNVMQYDHGDYDEVPEQADHVYRSQRAESFNSAVARPGRTASTVRRGSAGSQHLAAGDFDDLGPEYEDEYHLSHQEDFQSATARPGHRTSQIGGQTIQQMYTTGSEQYPDENEEEESYSVQRQEDYGAVSGVPGRRSSRIQGGTRMSMRNGTYDNIDEEHEDVYASGRIQDFQPAQSSRGGQQEQGRRASRIGQGQPGLQPGNGVYDEIPEYQEDVQYTQGQRDAAFPESAVTGRRTSQIRSGARQSNLTRGEYGDVSAVNEEGQRAVRAGSIPASIASSGQRSSLVRTEHPPPLTSGEMGDVSEGSGDEAQPLRRGSDQQPAAAGQGRRASVVRGEQAPQMLSGQYEDWQPQEQVGTNEVVHQGEYTAVPGRRASQIRGQGPGAMSNGTYEDVNEEEEEQGQYPLQARDSTFPTTTTAGHRISVVQGGSARPTALHQGDYEDAPEEHEEQHAMHRAASQPSLTAVAAHRPSAMQSGAINMLRLRSGDFVEVPEAREHVYQLRRGSTPSGLAVTPGRRTSIIRGEEVVVVRDGGYEDELGQDATHHARRSSSPAALTALPGRRVTAGPPAIGGSNPAGPATSQRYPPSGPGPASNPRAGEGPYEAPASVPAGPTPTDSFVPPPPGPPGGPWDQGPKGLDVPEHDEASEGEEHDWPAPMSTQHPFGEQPGYQGVPQPLHAQQEEYHAPQGGFAAPPAPYTQPGSGPPASTFPSEQQQQQHEGGRVPTLNQAGPLPTQTRRDTAPPGQQPYAGSQPTGGPRDTYPSQPQAGPQPTGGPRDTNVPPGQQPPSDRRESSYPPQPTGGPRDTYAPQQPAGSQPSLRPGQQLPPAGSQPTGGPRDTFVPPGQQPYADTYAPPGQQPTSGPRDTNAPQPSGPRDTYTPPGQQPIAGSQPTGGRRETVHPNVALPGQQPYGGPRESFVLPPAGPQPTGGPRDTYAPPGQQPYGGPRESYVPQPATVGPRDTYVPPGQQPPAGSQPSLRLSQQPNVGPRESYVPPGQQPPTGAQPSIRPGQQPYAGSQLTGGPRDTYNPQPQAGPQPTGGPRDTYAPPGRTDQPNGGPRATIPAAPALPARPQPSAFQQPYPEQPGQQPPPGYQPTSNAGPRDTFVPAHEHEQPLAGPQPTGGQQFQPQQYQPQQPPGGPQTTAPRRESVRPGQQPVAGSLPTSGPRDTLVPPGQQPWQPQPPGRRDTIPPGQQQPGVSGPRDTFVPQPSGPRDTLPHAEQYQPPAGPQRTSGPRDTYAQHGQQPPRGPQQSTFYPPPGQQQPPAGPQPTGGPRDTYVPPGQQPPTDRRESSYPPPAGPQPTGGPRDTYVPPGQPQQPAGSQPSLRPGQQPYGGPRESYVPPGQQLPAGPQPTNGRRDTLAPSAGQVAAGPQPTTGQQPLPLGPRQSTRAQFQPENEVYPPPQPPAAPRQDQYPPSHFDQQPPPSFPQESYQPVPGPDRRPSAPEAPGQQPVSASNGENPSARRDTARPSVQYPQGPRDVTVPEHAAVQPGQDYMPPPPPQPPTLPQTQAQYEYQPAERRNTTLAPPPQQQPVVGQPPESLASQAFAPLASAPTQAARAGPGQPLSQPQPSYPAATTTTTTTSTSQPQSYPTHPPTQQPSVGPTSGPRQTFLSTPAAPGPTPAPLVPQPLAVPLVPLGQAAVGETGLPQGWQQVPAQEMQQFSRPGQRPLQAHVSLPPEGPWDQWPKEVPVSLPPGPPPATAPRLSQQPVAGQYVSGLPMGHTQPLQPFAAGAPFPPPAPMAATYGQPTATTQSHGQPLPAGPGSVPLSVWPAPAGAQLVDSPMQSSQAHNLSTTFIDHGPATTLRSMQPVLAPGAAPMLRGIPSANSSEALYERPVLRGSRQEPLYATTATLPLPPGRPAEWSPRGVAVPAPGMNTEDIIEEEELLDDERRRRQQNTSYVLDSRGVPVATRGRSRIQEIIDVSSTSRVIDESKRKTTHRTLVDQTNRTLQNTVTHTTTAAPAVVHHHHHHRHRERHGGDRRVLALVKVTTNQIPVGSGGTVQSRREEEEEITHTASSARDLAHVASSSRGAIVQDSTQDTVLFGAEQTRQGGSRHGSNSSESSHERNVTTTHTTSSSRGGAAAVSASAVRTLVTVTTDILCAQCHATLRGLRALQVVDYFFHEECFKCFDCQVPLLSDFILADDHVYCHMHGEIVRQELLRGRHAVSSSSRVTQTRAVGGAVRGATTTRHYSSTTSSSSNGSQHLLAQQGDTSRALPLSSTVVSGAAISGPLPVASSQSQSHVSSHRVTHGHGSHMHASGHTSRHRHEHHHSRHTHAHQANGSSTSSFGATSISDVPMVDESSAARNMSPMEFDTAAPCPQCAQPIGFEATNQLFVTGHGGPVFHRRCFKCATCGADFGLISGPPDVQRTLDGRYHCLSHAFGVDWPQPAPVAQSATY